MTKVSQYHTNSPEYSPKDREVHHDRDDCPTGKKIKPEHLEFGTWGKPLCDRCEELGMRG
jgi:hypothetical protein